MDPRLIRHPATDMAIGHRKPQTYHRSAGASCEGQSKTYTCAALDVNGELLYLRPFRARVRAHVRREGIPPYEGRTRVELLYLTATSDERARIEARQEGVAVHRAEWVIHGCEDEIGREYDELPERGR